MQAEELLPVHPADIIREDILVPLGKTPYWLAKSLQVPYTRIQDILAKRRGISSDTAMRLARLFNTTPQFWLNLQNQYDIEVVRQAHAEDYERIVPLAA